MDLGLLYRGLVDQQVNLVAGNATDAQIEKLKLVILTDDKRYFPPYEAAPVVRQPTLERYPGAADALARLAGRLQADTMRRLNYAVDGEHRDQATVVREFLRP
jgi:osmoprotectant transport system substrate-binding protein